MTHPAHIQDMIDDFAFLDDWEDRYMHVIELGKALPQLTEAERNPATKVKGCVSQVWLVKAINGERLTYRGDSDAHIVKGLVGVTLALFSGQSAKDILAIDAKAVFADLGLSEHLSMQRSNGLAAMVARIQNDACALVGL
ncbi:MAG: SufE family protein [Robiginitomaculum sp.]